MFKRWPKIPRLENEVYHITEKIDGTNACIIIQHRDNLPRGVFLEEPITEIDGHGVWAQSKTKLIYPNIEINKTLDNFGFAKWVYNNSKQLVNDLGVGYHFGEWWGQGINRGYGLEERRFSLFNPTKQSSCCYNVPYLWALADAPNKETIDLSTDWLQDRGSQAAPGYMKPEGLVVYAEKAKTYWKVIMDK